MNGSNMNGSNMNEGLPNGRLFFFLQGDLAQTPRQPAPDAGLTGRRVIGATDGFPVIFSPSP
jgi:hypothetical protein